MLEQHYNNPNHTWQLCPHIEPMPVEVVPFSLEWVQPAKPPRPYGPLGLCARPAPHRQVTYVPLLRVGPCSHFPLGVGDAVHISFKPPYLPRVVFESNKRPLRRHILLHRCQSTLHLSHSITYLGSYGCSNLGNHVRHSHVIVALVCYP